MNARFPTIIIRPCLRQYILQDAPLILLCAACMLYRLCFVGRGADAALALGLILAAILIYRCTLLCRSIYIITDEMLVYDRGILVRHCDYLELYRVVDFQEMQTMLQQLCGIKTVIILSGDRTMPRLHIVGVPERQNLVREMRERVEYNKNRKGIYEITNR